MAVERVKQIASHFSRASGVELLERQSPDDVVITMAIRTPLCKAKKGGLKDTKSDELLLEIYKVEKYALPCGGFTQMLHFV